MKWFKTGHPELYTWSLIWFTLPLWNLGNSISILLFGILVLFKYTANPHRIKSGNALLPALFGGLFLMHIFSDLNAGNSFTEWPILERKISLLFLPGILLLLKPDITELRKYAFTGLAAGISFAGIVMLTNAFLQFLSDGQIDTFIYHNLTSPFLLGAIYFSLLIAALLIALTEKETPWLYDRLYLPLLFFFSILLLLCASKLFVIVTLPLVLFRLWHKHFSKKAIRWPIVLIIIAMIAGLYPTIFRISALRDLNLEVLSQEDIGPGTGLNGVNLRLLQWKFGLEIIAEQQAIIFGTGVSNRQNLLNEKYLAYNLYTGDVSGTDRGFLDMNFHNQWMETFLGTGLSGFLLLFSIAFFSMRSAPNSLLFPLPVIFLLIFFFFTESVMERQIGLIFFILSMCNFYAHSKNS